MSSAKTCVIVGGGFRGMIAAYLLQKRGVQCTLIDKAPFLGGIMFSREWNGYYVDNGVHLFDSIPKNLGAIVEEVMEGKVVPISFNYASVYNDHTTPGLAIPDLTVLPQETKTKILFEVIERLPITPRENPANLYEKMFDLYGRTAADIFDASMYHIYRISTKEVEPDSIRQTAFHRLRFLPDNMTLELKKHPLLDQRLAAMRVNLGKVDDLVSMYPSEGGMRSFCVQMSRKLEEMGTKVMVKTNVKSISTGPNKVTLQLEGGEQIEANHLLWAQDHGILAKIWKDDDRLEKLMHGTPMVLYYFEVDRKHVKDYTYFHQFTPGRLVFRSAGAGVYSNQIKANNKTYVSVECPANIGTDFWENPGKYTQQVWQECVNMDLVDKNTPFPEQSTFIKAPVTHRFPKVGYTQLCQELDQIAAETNGVVIIPQKEAFTRREIMWTTEAAVEKLMAL